MSLTNPVYTWVVAWAPREKKAKVAACVAMEFVGREGADRDTDPARLQALTVLEDQRRAGSNWGKCYAYRDSDGRYLFEAEFQQRT